jgi:hypothetical protein
MASEYVWSPFLSIYGRIPAQQTYPSVTAGNRNQLPITFNIGFDMRIQGEMDLKQLVKSLL